MSTFCDRSPFPDYHRLTMFQHMLASFVVHLYALLSVEKELYYKHYKINDLEKYVHAV